MGRHALKEHTVDAADNNRLVLIQNQIAIGSPIIAEKPAERDGDFAVCKPFSLSPGAVFRNAPAFLLRKRGHDGQKKFTLSIECPDILLLEIDLCAVFFQLPYGRKAVHRVPGKSADALSHN